VKLSGIKKFLGRFSVPGEVGERVAPGSERQKIVWLGALENPWDVPVLDVRSVTLTMTAASKDPECAKNAISFLEADGREFIGKEPEIKRAITADLQYPIDGFLADGILFRPVAMEHKWAIFYFSQHLIFVRSWTRRVMVVAETAVWNNSLEVMRICGCFASPSETPDFTQQTLDYLLRSHALGLPHPLPLPAAGTGDDPQHAAQWCFSMFGNRALVASSQAIPWRPPQKPLRTISLLHIAVARSNFSEIEQQLQAGVPIDLLAADGLAPLHWALASKDLTLLAFLLERGSPIDVRSDQGATPLMNAAESGSVEIVRFLLDRGADVNAADLQGQTPEWLAEKHGHASIVELLKGTP